MRPALTRLAGGTSSALFAAAISTHGTPGLVIGTVLVTFTVVVEALAPEIFWLAALILAARERRWLLTHASTTTPGLQRSLTTHQPFTEIAQARRPARKPRRQTPAKRRKTSALRRR